MKVIVIKQASLCFIFIMLRIDEHSSQNFAIKVLLDCSNTRKTVTPKDSRSVTGYDNLAPWNHKFLKNRKNKKLKELNSLLLRKKVKQAQLMTSLSTSLPKVRLERRSEAVERKSHQGKIVDLSQSFQQEHMRRQNLFKLRKTNRRYHTLDKY